MSQYRVLLKTIAEELEMEVLHQSSVYGEKYVTKTDVNRPALQLAGFYNYFDPHRLQCIGRVESTFLETMTEDQRRLCFQEFMKHDIDGLIICHNCVPFPAHASQQGPVVHVGVQGVAAGDDLVLLVGDGGKELEQEFVLNHPLVLQPVGYAVEVLVLRDGEEIGRAHV